MVQMINFMFYIFFHNKKVVHTQKSILPLHWPQDKVLRSPNVIHNAPQDLIPIYLSPCYYSLFLQGLVILSYAGAVLTLLYKSLHKLFPLSTRQPLLHL